MGIKDWVRRVIGSQHDREVRRLLSVVEEVDEIYGELSELSDEDLGGKTLEFRTYIAERVGDTENRIREVREKKAKSTATAEREALSVELSELEATLGYELEAALDDLLPEAFAVVTEVCRRLVGREIIDTGQRLVWDMIPYDVQIVGAIALHRGTATEMATGEGKTLAATMPLYLNALAGRGAHLVTVNSYLAERDAAWMGAIYSFLGM